MKIAIITFSYWRDFYRAKFLHNNIKSQYTASNGKRVEIVKFWCIEPNDKSVELHSLCERTIVMPFDRGRGLSGLACALSMCQIYDKLLNDFDAVIKLDSDTRLFDIQAFIEAFAHKQDIVGALRFPAEASAGMFNGCCYGFSRNVKPVLCDYRAVVHTIKDNRLQDYLPEDIFFGVLFSKVKDLRVMNFPKENCFMSIAPYVGGDCIVAHFGYCSDKRMISVVEEIDAKRAEFDAEHTKADKTIIDAFQSELNGISARNYPPYDDKYDDNGNQKSIPAGSVLLGYDSQSRAHWSFPSNIKSAEGLFPFPQSEMKKYEQNNIH